MKVFQTETQLFHCWTIFWICSPGIIQEWNCQVVGHEERHFDSSSWQNPKAFIQITDIQIDLFFNELGQKLDLNPIQKQWWPEEGCTLLLSFDWFGAINVVHLKKNDKKYPSHRKFCAPQVSQFSSFKWEPGIFQASIDLYLLHILVE